MQLNFLNKVHFSHATKTRSTSFLIEYVSYSLRDFKSAFRIPLIYIIFIMLTEKERTAFHSNTTLDGKPLSAKERETLMRRFLPPTPSNDSPAMSPYPSRTPSQTPHQRRKPTRRKPIRTFMWTRIYQLFHVIILALFGLYIRLRQAYHAVIDRVLAVLFYHHRTPDWIRKDLQGLKKLPEHLSIVLSLDEERLQPSGLESLLNDVGDLAAWCASAGIPMISIYERKGGIATHPPIFELLLKLCRRYSQAMHSTDLPTDTYHTSQLLWRHPLCSMPNHLRQSAE